MAGSRQLRSVSDRNPWKKFCKHQSSEYLLLRPRPISPACLTSLLQGLLSNSLRGIQVRFDTPTNRRLVLLVVLCVFPSRPCALAFIEYRATSAAPISLSIFSPSLG